MIEPTMTMRSHLLVAAALVFLAFPVFAQKFGISKAQLGSPVLAAVSPFSTSIKDDPSGPTYGTWSCSNGDCLLFSMPIGVPVTTTVAIFKFGSWRIAATCQADEWHACTTPKHGTSAWIVLRKNGEELRVLFVSRKKLIKQSQVEKKLHSVWNWNRNIWKIVSVHNVDTNETWPKTLQQEMAK